MKLFWAAFLFVIFSVKGFCAFEVQKYDWNGLEVHWLKNEGLPVFSGAFYFSDGTLGENDSNAGVTNMTFDLLKTGAKDLNQFQIANVLDKLAFSFSSQVGKEYSTLNFQGLLKEINPSMELFCQLYSSPTFPKAELQTAVNQTRAELENLAISPAGVADRAFGYYVYEGTPFGIPESGFLQSVNAMKQSDLLERWSELTGKVKKKLFLSGPEKILEIKDLLLKNCKLDEKNRSFERAQVVKEEKRLYKWKNLGKIIFIPIPNSNQVQIRIGRSVPYEHFAKNFDINTLSTGILGSGFSSLLMKEVRTKRGLTYSIASYSSPRLTYGMSLISTFTKNETIQEILDTIKVTLIDAQQNFKSEELLANSKKFLKGRHLFRFDDSDKLVSTLILYNHLGRPFTELTSFAHNIDGISIENVKSNLLELYPVDDMVTVLVGDEKVGRELKERLGTNLQLRDLKDIL